MATNLTSELVLDEIGYREWDVDSNGKTYRVYLRRQEDHNWKWGVKNASSFPHELKEWADEMVAHFNANARV